VVLRCKGKEAGDCPRDDDWRQILSDSRSWRESLATEMLCSLETCP
jgi:hypothetical protein